MKRPNLLLTRQAANRADVGTLHYTLSTDYEFGRYHLIYRACIELQPCVLLRIESWDNPEGTALWERRYDTIDCMEVIPHNLMLDNDRPY